jgi:hypothetical protein
MTDKERAAGLIHRIAGAQSGTEALAEVVADFTAVRLEECRAIVAYLRAEADARRIGLGAVGAQALEEASDQIERRAQQAGRPGR